MNRIRYASLAAFALLAITANAQWLGFQNEPAFTSHSTDVYFNDFAAGTAESVATFQSFEQPYTGVDGFRVMASDHRNFRIFGGTLTNNTNPLGGLATQGTDVYQHVYSEGGFISSQRLFTTFQALPNANRTVDLNGLAYDSRRGQFYGFRNLNQNLSSTFGGWIQGGMFRIDSSTGQMNATSFVAEGTTEGGFSTHQFSIRGMGYDEVTDRIYMLENRTASNTRVLSFNPETEEIETVLVLNDVPFFAQDNLQRAPNFGAGGGRLVFQSMWNGAPEGSTVENPTGNLQGFHREFDLLTGTFTENVIPTPYGDWGCAFNNCNTPVPTSGGMVYAPNFYEPIPEPATMIGLGLGAALLAARRRRKKA